MLPVTLANQARLAMNAGDADIYTLRVAMGEHARYPWEDWVEVCAHITLIPRTYQLIPMRGFSQRSNMRGGYCMIG